MSDSSLVPPMADTDESKASVPLAKSVSKSAPEEYDIGTPEQLSKTEGSENIISQIPSEDKGGINFSLKPKESQNLNIGGSKEDASDKVILVNKDNEVISTELIPVTEGSQKIIPQIPSEDRENIIVSASMEPDERQNLIADGSKKNSSRKVTLVDKENESKTPVTEASENISPQIPLEVIKNIDLPPSEGSQSLIADGSKKDLRRKMTLVDEENKILIDLLPETESSKYIIPQIQPGDKKISLKPEQSQNLIVDGSKVEARRKVTLLDSQNQIITPELYPETEASENLISQIPSEDRQFEEDARRKGILIDDEDLEEDFFDKYAQKSQVLTKIEGMDEVVSEIDETETSIKASKGGSVTLSTADAMDSSTLKSFKASLGTLLAAERQSAGTTTRPSVFFSFSHRLDSSDTELDDFFDFTQKSEVVRFDKYEEAVEEEQPPSVVEEEEEALDRQPYYERYNKIIDGLTENRWRNYILQKKLAIMLKRRKVQHFLKTSEPPLDQVNKYHIKLKAYGEMLRQSGSRHETLGNEVACMRARRDEKRSNLKNMFQSMQKREAQIGHGLIHSKTGHSIPDKLVDRLIRRQKTQLDQASSMRLQYIKLREMIQEKLIAIEEINCISSKHKLVDFEQLKLENRSYEDKIEEREEELSRLRVKGHNIIQSLAHMREKSAALDCDLVDLRDYLDRLTSDYMDNRFWVNDIKKKKVAIRQRIEKFKDDSGLLTHMDLLCDMQADQRQYEKEKEDLRACMKDVDIKTVQVRNVRKNKQILMDELHRRKMLRNKGINVSNKIHSKHKFVKKVLASKLNAPPEALFIYKGRPTLYMPIITASNFDDLVTIKPNPVSSTRRKHNTPQKKKNNVQTG